MTIENKREIYLNALATVGELILLGERFIPTGPKGAYTIIDDLMAYVQSLEREIVSLRTAQNFQSELIKQSQAKDVAKTLEPIPQVDACELGTLREALQKAHEENAAKQKLRNYRDNLRELNREFPKVTL